MTSLNTRQFHQIIELFKMVSGNSISEEKKDMVESRLRRRLYSLGLENFDEYLYVLQQFPDQEIPHLVSLLTTHTTKFFRESIHFDLMTSVILPKYLHKDTIEVFRVWIAACSTGEEAYSMAITIDAYCKSRGLPPNFEILATDIDRIAVKKAKDGHFANESLASIPGRHQLHYILREAGRAAEFTFKDDVRQKIRWDVVNLKDKEYVLPTNYRYDMIFARNVFIYFSRVEIEHIVKQFSKFLKPEGRLALGLSENLQNIKCDYQLEKNSIYRLTSVANAERARSAGAFPISQPFPSSAAPGVGQVGGEAGGLAVVTPEQQKGDPRNHSNFHNHGATRAAIRILLVDDSKTVHEALKRALSKFEDIEILGQAYNGREALELLRSHTADVILSDIHMPEMDGLALLQSQMATYQIPTVMFSSVSDNEATKSLRIFDLGAVAYVEKPRAGGMDPVIGEIVEKIRNAAATRVVSTRNPSPIVAPTNKLVKSIRLANRIILIGASTGGPDAITSMLSSVPRECPAILIVQHMPTQITKAFAARLASLIDPTVREAQDGEPIMPGNVYIAPGGFHLELRDVGGILRAEVTSKPPVNQVRPSIDVLFKSALAIRNRISIAACLLTGMGKDGAAGIKALRDGHVPTFAQDERTSVVFGMAKAAIEMNGIDHVCSITEMAGKVFDAFELMDRSDSRRRNDAA